MTTLTRRGATTTCEGAAAGRATTTATAATAGKPGRGAPPIGVTARRRIRIAAAIRAAGRAIGQRGGPRDHEHTWSVTARRQAHVDIELIQRSRLPGPGELDRGIAPERDRGGLQANERGALRLDRVARKHILVSKLRVVVKLPREVQTAPARQLALTEQPAQNQNRLRRLRRIRPEPLHVRAWPNRSWAGRSSDSRRPRGGDSPPSATTAHSSSSSDDHGPSS